MIAEFSINPLNTEHMSMEIAQVIEILQSTGLDYRLGPMGTCIEGNPDAVLEAIRRCHAAVAGRHERVITTVIMDDRKNEPHHLSGKITSVENQLGYCRLTPRES